MLLPEARLAMRRKQLMAKYLVTFRADALMTVSDKGQVYRVRRSGICASEGIKDELCNTWDKTVTETGRISPIKACSSS